ncbi:general substrate transporter [Hypoxylon rubiginosum]|uniref:General substrate transporter n=1 Tax=Hypoxylon rubiginosum TaxID=110542 RepID=A0ACB9ZIQ7_9PEZI|nr:general substrate transporter [Hypoxylon rubiginosum]
MAISVEAPLISHREDRLDDDSYSDHSDADDVGVEWPAGRPGLFIWLLTLSAGISGLLFGYDTGVISATLVSIGTSLSGKDLNSLDKSAVTSCTALFALLASPISSIFADRFGRKPVILLSDLLFVFGALVQALSTSVLGMVLGRSIVGAAVGAASFVTPLYIAELAPPAYRGMLVTMNVLSITLGQVVAYIIGWIFAEHGDPSTGWRWMVGLGALPAILQCILLLLMPETPRWLVKAGKSAEARQIIEKTIGSDADSHRFLIDSVVKSIEIEIREEQGNALLATNGRKSRSSLLQGWHELLRVPKNRRALVIACLLQGLQQLCGFNSLMYFSATIFTMLGFSIPTLTSLTVAATNFTFTILALVSIDRIGRRRILLYSIPFMTIGLFLSAFGFSLIRLPSGGTNVGDHIPVTADATSISSRQAAIVILLSIMIYVASYALGLGNVPWMQSELFPLNVRSLGSGLATATNWLANFIIGLTFLPL